MKKIIWIFLIILLFAPDLYAGDVGKAVALQGRVDIFKNNSGTAVPLIEDQVVSAGDSVRTKSGSKAQINFNDGTILRITQNSKVFIKDYQIDDKGMRKSAAIELSRGKVRAVIAKMKDSSEFVIFTPNSRGSVRGSDIVASFQAGSSGMFVKEGRLTAINLAYPDKKIVVPEGNSCIIPPSESPKGPRPYLDAEKKLNEEETDIPVSISKTGRASVIKGAVAKISGAVNITPKGEAHARSASINDIIGEGDSIETGANGYIEIRLDNNNAINLKPDTKLFIVRLLINSSTGEFENIFEVTKGNIKARIEGLKGNSKFEVKTPMALCGARGTIIYVTVTANATVSFFEGGNGYMTNALSGNTQNVGAGQSSTADYTGTVTIPIYVSDTQRQSYADGWDASAGYEGYSSPDGGAGEDLYGAGSNYEAINFGAESVDQTLAKYFSGLPFSDVVNNLTSSSAQATNFSGSFGKITIDYIDDVPKLIMSDTPDSSVNGYIVFGLPNTPEWKGTSTYCYVTGSYINPKNDIFWTGDIQGDTSDGGAYRGWIGGRLIDMDGSPQSDGKVFCIYVDPAGNGGTFSSYFSDGVYVGGVFDGSSSSMEFLKRRSLIGISPEDLLSATMEESTLEARGSGNFFDGGKIDCELLGGKGMSIQGENWGIWHMEAKGTYCGATSDIWALALGGKIVNTSDNGEAYWLGTISSDNSRWGSGGLKNGFKGIYFDRGELTGSVRAGIIDDGDILGYYLPDGVYGESEGYGYGYGSWNMIGGGEWAEATKLLNEGERGLGFMISDLKSFVSLPITEVHSSLMTMSSCVNSSFTAVNMDARFYQNAENMRLWASRISGAYPLAPTNPSDWQIILSAPDQYNVTISGDQWNPDGTWHARIINATADNGNISFSGEAAGTHSDGNFNGVGAGQWSNPA